MNKQKFTKKAEKLIESLEDLINKMPYKGDKETVSQKIYMLNKLKSFECCVNGLEDCDFVEGVDV